MTKILHHFYAVMFEPHCRRVLASGRAHFQQQVIYPPYTSVHFVRAFIMSRSFSCSLSSTSSRPFQTLAKTRGKENSVKNNKRK